jgi:SAM-dependent methyltransferase
MAYCRERGLRRLVAGRVEALPFGAETFHLLVALDLLEHIDDDAGLMRELWRVCRPDGHLLLSVPAYRFLWSDHDEALHHRRRYTRRSLLGLIRGTEFRIIRFTHAITFLLPPIATFRLAQRMVRRGGKPKTHLIPLPATVNRLLIGLLRLEARCLRGVNFPFGVSIVALLEKPGDPSAAHSEGARGVQNA